MTRYTQSRIPRLHGRENRAELQHNPEFTSLLRDLDPTALEVFYEEYFDRIYGYVRSLVGHEHSAEDLTHDVFFKIHRSLPRFEVGRDLDPWVFAIASNQVRDHWRLARTRLAQREQDIDECPSVDALSDDGPRPEDGLEHGELSRDVREVIQLLPDSMRQCVELRLFEGLEFDEVGERIGRSEVAARKRYSRALGLLRGLMAETWQLHARPA